MPKQCNSYTTQMAALNFIFTGSIQEKTRKKLQESLASFRNDKIKFDRNVQCSCAVSMKNFRSHSKGFKMLNVKSFYYKFFNKKRLSLEIIMARSFRLIQKPLLLTTF